MSSSEAATWPLVSLQPPLALHPPRALPCKTEQPRDPSSLPARSQMCCCDSDGKVCPAPLNQLGPKKLAVEAAMLSTDPS